MSRFRVHDLASAPEDSRVHLKKVQKAFGAIPNLFGVFAESPALLEGYMALGEVLERASDFDATEKEIVLLTTSFENDCDYCMAAHSTISKAEGVSAAVITSLRDGTPIDDPKLEALRIFTRSVVVQRGFVDEEALEAFLAAGYQQRHVLEVILGVGFKTLSNFTNHVAEPPLDKVFSGQSWSKPVTIGF
jgi:uncharacterized peroxidase-related enzyme